MHEYSCMENGNEEEFDYISVCCSSLTKIKEDRFDFYYSTFRFEIIFKIKLSI